MKIIITENQHNVIKQKLLDLVKRHGFDTGIIVIRSSDKLKEIAFDNNPMNFLNLYDDLITTKSEGIIYFKNKNNDNFIIYSEPTNVAYFDYINIWSILEEEFNLTYSEVQNLTKVWLEDVYGFDDVKTHQITL